ncbi:carboxyl transferase domain-containing protein [Serpentinicella sp. ANB-PHB4]|uniref:acyl-CoA carboxylase subunit beta n=1 Tax=Serpentinicella sp. ANB-PHB4 TaxID=3074076 RepID=UPI0028627D71|nr:carboxyl transferase domain-containing protein [Serpentinicella sp. ANB-PHB4]MDR5659118.1 carboxyl transferase domain-containing protein [Serpentinicella sp. ANB-PHB4]
MPNTKLGEFRRERERYRRGQDIDDLDLQKNKNKRTARERISLLFDEGTFVELDIYIKNPKVGLNNNNEVYSGEGVITGYGLVDGRLVYAYAQEHTVMEGAVGEVQTKKIARIQQMALKMGAPIVALKDSSGAKIEEGIDALAGYAEILKHTTRLSGVVPQISAVMGSCAGVAGYVPALTDFIFMIEEISQMFITGPSRIESVTGEQVSMEALGGAMIHNRKSGVAHFITKTEEECIKEIRKLLNLLPSNNMDSGPITSTGDIINRTNLELEEIISNDTSKNYDMKVIAHSISDDGYFFEVQKHYAQNIIIAFIKMNGQTVGLIGSQPMVLEGALDINALNKAARFIRFCNSFNIPILTIVDSPGFLPDIRQEYGGVIRHGAKLIYAYAEATVPKVTLITKRAYGGGYLAMGNKNLGADLVFAWPTAEIAIMDPEAAANIIYKNEIAHAEDPKDDRVAKIEQYKKEVATPYKAAEMGYVDDVIEPSATRPRIIDALNMLATKRELNPAKKHGNIPL